MNHDSRNSSNLADSVRVAGDFLFILRHLNLIHSCIYVFFFFLSILSRSNFDYHLRCGGWLNFEFSKREKHSGWAMSTSGEYFATIRFND